VLLGHAHALGELVVDPHAWCVHGCHDSIAFQQGKGIGMNGT
jgi:hypothetical protein